MKIFHKITYPTRELTETTRPPRTFATGRWFASPDPPPPVHDT
ncbi:hypothetical protein [Rhodopirellula sallentina]|uniref:Uncharacterized protein n=1 Tax=Rhodopirellula sallentina SM41 TaxID=1263870 RepID=M5UKN6_9BACT|nr:hypothetical protein [Rhodopirellula sallentina]EMI58421.1 hypothetical protein RSSM_00148 [Rhodopirellula sallentina SM41]